MPPQVLIGGALAVVLLLAVAVLMPPNQEATPGKTTRTATPPVLAKFPTTPPAPPKTAPLRPPPTSPPSPPPHHEPPRKKDASIEDFRENYARRLWGELKNKLDANPAARWSAQKDIRDFIGTYGSTASGKEARDYLKKHAGDIPPRPTPERTIAKLREDYVERHPKTGWQYLWNANGEVGRSANYKPLVWNDAQKCYTGNAKIYPHRGTPHHYIRLSSHGGHPGAGVRQKESKGIDRFAIAAYTLRTGQAGKIAISGRISCREGAGRVELRLYVNDELKGSSFEPGGGAPRSFSTWLGELKQGDTVYVAVGPDKADGNDSFNLSFVIFK